jgi:threonine/homoserine/homoserine lactone efflux protein
MALTTSTRTSPARARRDADGMAVASFVLGLIGTLLFNAVFGPCAIVLGTLAIARETRRRGRAMLGIALGIADVALLVVLMTLDHSVSWQFGG